MFEIKLFRCGPDDKNWAADVYVKAQMDAGVGTLLRRCRIHCGKGLPTKIQALMDTALAIEMSELSKPHGD